MTTVRRITVTAMNYVVLVRTSFPVIFYGWNSAVIKSVTPMPDGEYLLDGQVERPGCPRATVVEIVDAFEKMAVIKTSKTT